jgi:uncharacterized protein (DUF1330 family)
VPAKQPRPDQLQTFLERKPVGPVYMLNLLKFKEKAEYEDGRDTDLSGAEAYGLYGVGVSKIINSLGGSFEFAGKANALVIGDGELEWNSVAIVKYPRFEDFVQMTQSAEYQELHVHRDAGLDHQVLINCLAADQVAAMTGTAQ